MADTLAVFDVFAIFACRDESEPESLLLRMAIVDLILKIGAQCMVLNLYGRVDAIEYVLFHVSIYSHNPTLANTEWLDSLPAVASG